MNTEAENCIKHLLESGADLFIKTRVSNSIFLVVNGLVWEYVKMG
jgi:hypothetical protein